MKMFTCTCVQDEVTHHRLRVSFKKSNVGSPPSPACNTPPRGKAAVMWTRGSYAEYVSTEKWRERRWRLFSTDPEGETVSEWISLIPVMA
jgi:hypothetical protein